MSKIKIKPFTSGTEFDIDGAPMIVSGVSSSVGRDGSVEWVTVNYDKKPEEPKTATPAEPHTESVVLTASEDDAGNGKSGRTLAGKTVIRG